MARARIESNFPLQPLTTFKIGGPAKYFVSVGTPAEINEARKFAQETGLALFVLGGGSNILVSDRGFDGLVVHPVQKGILLEAGTQGTTIFRIQAAELWDDVVRQAVQGGLWGIENLSHIPGQAGAALVQNIGAYGQQIADTLARAEVMSLRDGSVRTLRPTECAFGYRKSIFNTTAKNDLIILRFELRLAGSGQPNLRYPDVKAYFADRGGNQPSLEEIREAVISIRDRKFPYPREEKGGNAGSFFKNLLLSERELATLRASLRRNFGRQELVRFEEICERSASAPFKIPAAFLIEICGLKGHRVGGAQVNEDQPLVLVNRGGATAEDVLRLAGFVRRSVRERTGMTLELEPELVGFTQQEIEAFFASDSLPFAS